MKRCLLQPAPLIVTSMGQTLGACRGGGGGWVNWFYIIVFKRLRSIFISGPDPRSSAGIIKLLLVRAHKVADCVKYDDNLSQNCQHCSSMVITACYSPVTAAPPWRSSWWLLQPLIRANSSFLLEAFSNCPSLQTCLTCISGRCSATLYSDNKPAFWCSTGLF